MTNKKQKRSHFSHLNHKKRDRIEALTDSGHLQAEIAAVLKVDPSTISREINKRKRRNGHYDADTAEHKARVIRSRASHKGRKIEHNTKLRAYIISNLKKKRSPDEISGRMKQEHQPFSVGKDAIYNWIYTEYGQQYGVYLCTKRYRPKKQRRNAKREMIPHRISLAQRPEHTEHAEGDLFVSPSNLHTTASGVLICIPSAQLLLGARIPNRKPSTMVEAVVNLRKQARFDDLTLDNGIENKYHEQFGLPTYFADAHAPWQKPHVENNIGLARKWFYTKGTDLRKISDNDLQRCLFVLNHKYRKSLGYKSAYEVAYERGIINIIPLSPP